MALPSGMRFELPMSLVKIDDPTIDLKMLRMKPTQFFISRK